MKQIIFIFSLLLVTSFSLHAQKSKEEKEELIYSKKIAFITEKLQITPEEAQYFWPVYNEYWKKKNKLVDERKKITNLSEEAVEKMTEKECKELADKYADIKLKESQLFHEYSTKFQEVLPSKKVLLLYISDSEFKSYLLKQLKNSN